MSQRAKVRQAAEQGRHVALADVVVSEGTFQLKLAQLREALQGTQIGAGNVRLAQQHHTQHAQLRQQGQRLQQRGSARFP